MNVVSFAFLLYVIAVCLVYFLFPTVLKLFRKSQWTQYQWTVLLAASWLFYLFCGGKCFLFLLMTTATIYLGAGKLQKLSELQRKVLAGQNVSERLQKRAQHSETVSAEPWIANSAGKILQKDGTPVGGRKLSHEEKRALRQAFTRKKRRVLWIVLLINFGLLAFFKYVPDLLGTAAHLFGRNDPPLSLLIPVGISFYTFQATGYLIDVYNGNVRAEKSFWKTALFVSFFPQIIQGPISFWDPVAGQLFMEHRPEWTRIKYGIELILWGYLRKMVLADRIVHDIYLVTDSYMQYSGSMVAVAVLLYAIQLYADFAGGIDISRGIAQILGIELPENFRQPYLATSINDYWRRWHITLGAWMKKYVFYPLALTPLFTETGKRVQKSRLGKTAFGKHLGKVLPASLSCIVVFLIVGIWHGAGGKYVAFGLWNGGIIFLSMILEPFFPGWKRLLHIREGVRVFRLFQVIRTFLLVYIGYVFDVAKDLASSLGILTRMLLHPQWNLRLLYNEINNTYEGFNTWNVLIVFGMTLLMLWVDLYHERHDRHLGGDGERLREKIDRGCFLKEWALVLVCVSVIVLLGVYGPGYDPVKFVYANF